MNRSQEELISYFENRVKVYLATLEKIFGPRDSRFEFGGVWYSDDDPHIWFPHGFHFRGGCQVDISISKEAWEKPPHDQGAWQLAHECVHLLDPVSCEKANVLEEGLATWFQCDRHYHDEIVQNYISTIKDADLKEYREAKDLVCKYGSSLRKAVKTLRLKGKRISDIDTHDLGRVYPDSSARDRERLCSLFDNKGPG